MTEVLHLLPVLSVDGAYGGPESVAVDQARMLRQVGINVTLLAARLDDTRPELTLDVDARTFRGRCLVRRRFATLWSARLLVEAVRSSRSSDVVHIHLPRDTCIMPIAVVLSALRRRLIIQPHGMIAGRRDSLAGRLYDRLLTAPVLRRASRVLCLSDAEAAELAAISPSARTVVVANALGETPAPRLDVLDDEKLIVFVSRLHKRKRPLLLAKAAVELSRSHPDLRFILAGPDEGELESVREAVAGCAAIELMPGQSRADALALMRRATVFVLPAVDEPFGMVVVEALSQGTPVVLAESAELANRVVALGAGRSFRDDDQKDLATVIAEVAFDPDIAGEMRERAWRAAAAIAPSAPVLVALERAYQSIGDEDA